MGRQAQAARPANPPILQSYLPFWVGDARVSVVGVSAGGGRGGLVRGRAPRGGA